MARARCSSFLSLWHEQLPRQCEYGYLHHTLKQYQSNFSKHSSPDNGSTRHASSKVLLSTSPAATQTMGIRRSCFDQFIQLKPLAVREIRGCLRLQVQDAPKYIRASHFTSASQVIHSIIVRSKGLANKRPSYRIHQRLSLRQQPKGNALPCPMRCVVTGNTLPVEIHSL